MLSAQPAHEFIQATARTRPSAPDERPNERLTNVGRWPLARSTEGAWCHPVDLGPHCGGDAGAIHPNRSRRCQARPPWRHQQMLAPGEGEARAETPTANGLAVGLCVSISLVGDARIEPMTSAV